MKTKLKILALILMLMTGIGMPMKKASAQNGPASFQVFYDELSPYGDWVYDQNYGYVWIPYTDPGFMPYKTNGYWVFTNYGWTWVSNYAWGWAPFHYGRWYFDPNYGPIWVPGYEWGPAWVVWRQSSGYYGWAPMGPGINLNMAFGPDYSIPGDRWIFVRNRDFCRRDIYDHYIDRSQNITIINNSTVINNTYIDNSRHSTYVAGPTREAVQRVYGHKIDPVAIRDNSRPGTRVENGKLDIYRPMVEKNTGKEKAIAPRSVTTYDNSKAVIERKSANTGKTGSQTIQRNDKMNRETSPANNRTTIENKQAQPGQNTKPVYERKQTPPERNSNTIYEKKNNPPVQETRPVNEQRQPTPVQKNNSGNNVQQQQKQQPAQNTRPEYQKQQQKQPQRTPAQQPAKSGKPVPKQNDKVTPEKKFF